MPRRAKIEAARLKLSMITGVCFSLFQELTFSPNVLSLRIGRSGFLGLTAHNTRREESSVEYGHITTCHARSVL
jgi:hypothetical protein